MKTKAQILADLKAKLNGKSKINPPESTKVEIPAAPPAPADATPAIEEVPDAPEPAPEAAPEADAVVGKTKRKRRTKVEMAAARAAEAAEAAPAEPEPAPEPPPAEETVTVEVPVPVDAPSSALKMELPTAGGKPVVLTITIKIDQVTS